MAARKINIDECYWCGQPGEVRPDGEFDCMNPKCGEKPKMKHTPGPWKIRYGGMPNDEGFGIASDNASNSCIVAERWPCTTTKEDRERMIADARLICEAPAMLAVLERMEMHYPQGINPHLDDAMTEVRRILAANYK